MLKFIRGDKSVVSFAIGDSAVPEMGPGDVSQVRTCIVDGPEKKMLARAGIRFPKIHGMVILPEQTAQMAAWNLAGIVAKATPKSQPLTKTPEATDGDGEEDSEGNEGDDDF